MVYVDKPKPDRMALFPVLCFSLLATFCYSFSLYILLHIRFQADYYVASALILIGIPCSLVCYYWADGRYHYTVTEDAVTIKDRIFRRKIRIPYRLINNISILEKVKTEDVWALGVQAPIITGVFDLTVRKDRLVSVKTPSFDFRLSPSNPKGLIEEIKRFWKPKRESIREAWTPTAPIQRGSPLEFFFRSHASILVIANLLSFILWLFSIIYAHFTFVTVFLSLLIPQFVIFLFSDRIVSRTLRTQRLEQGKIRGVVDRLSKRFGIPYPRVEVSGYASAMMNALTTGASQRRSVIILTEKILGLSEPELECVIAHELSHIRCRHLLKSLIAMSCACFFLAYLATIGLPLSTVPLIFVSLVPLTVLLPVSRSLEVQADLDALTVVGRPEYFIKTFEELIQSAYGRFSEFFEIFSYHKAEKFRENLSKQLSFQKPDMKACLLQWTFSAHPPMYYRVKILRSRKKYKNSFLYITIRLLRDSIRDILLPLKA